MSSHIKNHLHEYVVADYATNKKHWTKDRKLALTFDSDESAQKWIDDYYLGHPRSFYLGHLRVG